MMARSVQSHSRVARAVATALLGVAVTIAVPARAEEPSRTFEIYGFAQADAIYDFGRMNPDWDDAFRPSKIANPEGIYGSNDFQRAVTCGPGLETFRLCHAMVLASWDPPESQEGELSGRENDLVFEDGQIRVRLTLDRDDLRRRDLEGHLLGDGDLPALQFDRSRPHRHGPRPGHAGRDGLGRLLRHYGSGDSE